MRITEIFDSIQGEGPAMGVPCTFVRFAGCNLRCRWCDTPQSSWQPSGEILSQDEILRRIQRTPGRPVVITGGEPFIQGELSALCGAIRKLGHPVHMETAGTVFQDVEADIVCISPKLKGSAPEEGESPELYVRHESNRFNAASIQAFLEKWPKEVYLKFVVEREEEIPQVASFLLEIGFTDRDRVFLMPQSRTHDELTRLAPLVAEWCVKEGFRYSDRLHLRLWPGETGR